MLDIFQIINLWLLLSVLTEAIRIEQTNKTAICKDLLQVVQKPYLLIYIFSFAPLWNGWSLGKYLTFKTWDKIRAVSL